MGYQLSQFQTQFKKVADAKVPSAYGLIRGNPATVAKAESLIQGDSFLHPPQGNRTGTFKYDIFRDLITATLFDGPDSLGSRYEDPLDDGMPRSTIAFAACIIRCVIWSYIKNDKSPKTLDADADLLQYDRKATKGNDPVEPVDIPYEENDSEPDEGLCRIMHAQRRRNSAKLGGNN
ncbi:hypothetical protein RhiJN_10451 [Ceratobasidium sp. AG-Ba]|nr:hypothetical protein RhiJN_10451 [Ceratobasidium sp. AG-Ba]QRW11180.1 hypothetical protein RhiLY_10179 [Ceratobasidium sp. AG-Ba]